MFAFGKWLKSQDKNRPMLDPQFKITCMPNLGSISQEVFA